MVDAHRRDLEPLFVRVDKVLNALLDVLQVAICRLAAPLWIAAVVHHAKPQSSERAPGQISRAPVDIWGTATLAALPVVIVSTLIIEIGRVLRVLHARRANIMSLTDAFHEELHR